MSTPADSIIEHWNRSFRGWSEEYIKPFKSSIIDNCLFETAELEQGHSSALREIEKNKGDISQFVLEHTEQKYSALLPSTMLSDSYSFDATSYAMVYRATLDTLISWKPGTSNALSQVPLDIHYGSEHFVCKVRKYQLESMKKFIQATPGTKEIRGQWSVNVANDAMTVSFGAHREVVIVIKIGCFHQKLNLMYDENGVLRKNSKIRKQTLKTSCWGLEKTRGSSKFENSLIIQENYGIDITADDVLSISPIMVYVQSNRRSQLKDPVLRINDSDIHLHKAPFHIQAVVIPALSAEEEQRLRLKYRNTLLNGKTSAKTKLKGSAVIKKELNKKATKENDDGFYPIKGTESVMSSMVNGGSTSPLSIHSDNMELLNPFAFAHTPLYHDTSTPLLGMNDGYNYNNGYSYNPDPWATDAMNINEVVCAPMDEMDEVQRLRQENEMLLQRVTDQQRHIEFLAAQIETIHSSTQPPFDVYHPQRHNPLKRRRITVESLLPPAA